jgi:hypothetical protein
MVCIGVGLHADLRKICQLCAKFSAIDYEFLEYLPTVDKTNRLINQMLMTESLQMIVDQIWQSTSVQGLDSIFTTRSSQHSHQSQATFPDKPHVCKGLGFNP